MPTHVFRRLVSGARRGGGTQGGSLEEGLKLSSGEVGTSRVCHGLVTAATTVVNGEQAL